MKISCHTTTSTKNPLTGADIIHGEVINIVRKQKQIDFNSSPLLDLIKGKTLKITNNSVVLCNCGPHAYFYHYLREKNNLNFRIIRDVHTTFWSGYLFQESICKNFTCEGDCVLFDSEFTRQIFLKLFPESLNKNNTFVCNPILNSFPNMDVKKTKNQNFNLGFIGRISLAKNFDQVLDIFIETSKKLKNVKLLVAGNVTNKEFHETNIKKKLSEMNLNPNNYVHLNNGKFIPNEKIWDVYKNIDVLLFPSMFIGESGPVTILEAGHMETPVIAADYGGVIEVLDKRNLVPVKFRKGCIPLGYSNKSLGRIDVEVAVKKILQKDFSLNNKIEKYRNHDEKLIKIIKNEQRPERLLKLDKNMREFINNFTLSFYDVGLDLEKIIKIISKSLLKYGFSDFGRILNERIEGFRYNPILKIK